MTEAMPIDVARNSLEDIINRLPLGGTVTLVGPQGSPMALLVSLRAVPAVCQPEPSDLDARLDALAERVSRAWTGRRSTSAVLSEMRR
ncbi:MAG TPA: hypothetical protein VN455_04665 [Methanotrichaceae archaeon]|nr:hypothetical protein [Methanotrichaceae archaeon]